MREYISGAGEPADAASVAGWATQPRAVLNKPVDIETFRRAFCGHGRVSAAVKRGFDVVLAALLLLLLSPIFVLTAAVLSFHLRRHPIFAHQRVGREGMIFKCLKFRTMRDASASEEGVEDLSFKAGTDTRTTRLTRLLRRTSLDELPQLINVLTGDMSLVGPRPVVPNELHMWFGSLAGLLITVRPGMTGLWAVSGRSSLEYPGRAFIELQYVTRASLWLDLRILARTLSTILSGRGAI